MKKLNLVWIVLIITLVLPLSPTTAQDDYTVTVVGGQDEPQTYPDQEVEGFQFTDQAYRSLYPYGLEFKATIVPPAGVSYSSVTLFYTFSNSGKTGRINAEPGEKENEWIAVPYNAAGLPPLARDRRLLGRARHRHQHRKRARSRRLL